MECTTRNSHILAATHPRILKEKKLFVAFPWVVTSTGPGGLCVYFMTGTPKGSTESGFIEKPGIEPAIPGLQGIALIHYTTGASFQLLVKLVSN